MSNPGVIKLVSLRNVGPNVKRLDIEDNIGEAIHIHWNGFRLDLTIKEFLSLSNELDFAFQSLTNYNNFDLKNSDPLFLFEISKLLPYVTDVRLENIRISQLRAIVRVHIPLIGYIVIPKKINSTPAYKFLSSKSDEFVEYQQESYPGISNVSRLNNLINSIDSNGYPHEGAYITLFGNQKFIRDGQHRAAALAWKFGMDYTIPVRIIVFKGKKWRFNFYLNILRSVLINLVPARSHMMSTIFHRLRHSHVLRFVYNLVIVIVNKFR